jgi:hypothetical protein
MLMKGLRTCGTFWESSENLMGTQREQQQSNTPTLLQKEKNLTPWMNVASPHWLKQKKIAYLCSLPFLT